MNVFRSSIDLYLINIIFYVIVGSRSLHVNVSDHESKTEINKVKNSQTARRAVHW